MRLFNDPSTNWQRFGETDPYWAVLTDEKFRAWSIGPGSRHEFFQSGEDHLDSVVSTVRASIDETFSPARSLDFGCGVGRVLIPLARRYPEAVGLDVAASMLEEARKNLADHGVRAQLALADGPLTQLSGTFDFIHSYIVFQHIPPTRGVEIATTLLKRLKPGGIAALHFSYFVPLSLRQRVLRWARLRTSLAAAAGNLARRRHPKAPYMEVYEYNLSTVVETFRGAGCDALHLLITNHGGVLGAFILCQKKMLAEK